MIGSVAIHAPRPLSLSRSPRRGPCGSGQVVKARSAVSGGGWGSDQGRFGMVTAPGAGAARDNWTDGPDQLPLGTRKRLKASPEPSFRVQSYPRSGSCAKAPSVPRQACPRCMERAVARRIGTSIRQDNCLARYVLGTRH